MTKLLAALVLSLSGLTATTAYASGGDHDGWFDWSSGDHNWDHRDGGDNDDRDGSGGPRVAAPEIDPSSAVSALTLLVGGLAVLRGRSQKQ